MIGCSDSYGSTKAANQSGGLLSRVCVMCLLGLLLVEGVMFDSWSLRDVNKY
jgi:hypothetical protein